VDLVRDIILVDALQTCMLLHLRSCAFYVSLYIWGRRQAPSYDSSRLNPTKTSLEFETRYNSLSFSFSIRCVKAYFNNFGLLGTRTACMQ
jgi:hypothetical protein